MALDTREFTSSICLNVAHADRFIPWPQIQDETYTYTYVPLSGHELWPVQEDGDFRAFDQQSHESRVLADQYV